VHEQPLASTSSPRRMGSSSMHAEEEEERSGSRTNKPAFPRVSLTLSAHLTSPSNTTSQKHHQLEDLRTRTQENAEGFSTYNLHNQSLQPAVPWRYWSVNSRRETLPMLILFGFLPLLLMCFNMGIISTYLLWLLLIGEHEQPKEENFQTSHVFTEVTEAKAKRD